MKFDGGSDSGPLTPRIASWIRLARSRAGRQDHAIRRVESFDEGAAGLPKRARKLAVHPDFGVVVDHDLEDDRRSRRVSNAPTRSGIVMLVRYQLKHSFPVDRRVSSAAGSIASHLESSKSSRSGFRQVVVGLDRLPRRLQVGTGRVEIGLDDRRVAVAPLSFDQSDAIRGAEIDQRVRSTVDRSSDRMLRAEARLQGDRDGDNEGDDGKRARSHMNLRFLLLIPMCSVGFTW